MSRAIPRAAVAVLPSALLGVLLGALVGTLRPGAASAQAEGTAHLRWEAPPACGGASAARAAIEAVLGREVFVDGDVPAPLELEVRITPDGEGWRAALALGERSDDARGRQRLGSRELTSDARGCTALHRAVVFTASMLVDLRSPLRVPALPEPRRPRADITRDTRATGGSSPGWYLGGGLGVLGGTLPEVAATGLVTGGLTWDGYEVGVGVRGTWPVEIPGPVGTARVGLAQAGPRGCWDLGGEALRVGGCVLLWAGAGWARGRGFAENRTALVPTLTPAAHVRLSLMAEDWRVVGALGGGWNAIRMRIEYDTSEGTTQELDRAAPWTVALHLRVESVLR